MSCTERNFWSEIIATKKRKITKTLAQQFSVWRWKCFSREQLRDEKKVMMMILWHQLWKLNWQKTVKRLSLIHTPNGRSRTYACVCVCVRERERDRERVCGCVCVPVQTIIYDENRGCAHSLLTRIHTLTHATETSQGTHYTHLLRRAHESESDVPSTSRACATWLWGKLSTQMFSFFSGQYSYLSVRVR